MRSNLSLGVPSPWNSKLSPNFKPAGPNSRPPYLKPQIPSSIPLKEPLNCIPLKEPPLQHPFKGTPLTSIPLEEPLTSIPFKGTRDLEPEPPRLRGSAHSTLCRPPSFFHRTPGPLFCITGRISHPGACLASATLLHPFVPFEPWDVQAALLG